VIYDYHSTMVNDTQKNVPEVNVSQPIEEFVKTLRNQLAPKGEKLEFDQEIDAEETGESMARFYEKVRNLIEYKDDHLIKRNAIERIFKRNLIIEFRQLDFTDQFLDELVMTGYIERREIDAKLEKKIKTVIAKYQKAVRLLGGYDLKRWLVAIASCEIEEIIFPNKIRYALVQAMYKTVCERIIVQDGNLKGSEKDVQIFISVLKSLAKPDNAWLNYSLLKIFLSSWFSENISDENVAKMTKEMPRLMHSLKRKLANPISGKMGVALRKYAVYFNIFYDVALVNISKIEKIIQNPESLKFAVQMKVDDVYTQEMKKFRKRVRRSLIFLIITKIVLAAVVEYPFDLYYIGEVNMIPIYINLLFPPLYLIFLSATVHRPSEHNSTLIARGTVEIVYESKEDDPIAIVKLNDIETFSDKALYIFFILTYGISFGVAVWILGLLHFNWLGILIFLFLFSVVSFFNALVRNPIRELLVAREREGMLGMIIDTFSMPFVRIGKWMSVNFSRVNVLIFLFDVIIEAPFKVVVRFIRLWAGFIRRKKEEMI
jgi:hypothetical protein